MSGVGAAAGGPSPGLPARRQPQDRDDVPAAGALVAAGAGRAAGSPPPVRRLQRPLPRLARPAGPGRPAAPAGARGACGRGWWPTRQRWPGTTLVSHELFAAATAAQARAGDDVVRRRRRGATWSSRRATCCARSPRSGRSTSSTARPWRFDEFVDLRPRGRADRHGLVLAGAGLRRPGGALGGRAAAVARPRGDGAPAGSPPGPAVERFAGLLGLDPAAFDTDGLALQHLARARAGRAAAAGQRRPG